MSHSVSGSRARFALRFALTGAAAGLLAGCSNSERLSDPFSNPFQTTSNFEHPPVPSTAASMPVSPVQSRPLSAPIASSNLSPPAPAGPKVAAVAAPPMAQNVNGWSAQGGSPVIVGQGENANVLANRYGVPVEALIRTNGFSSAADIKPGSHIVIPVYNSSLAASSGAATAPAKSAQLKSQQAKSAPVKVAAAEAPRTLATQAAALKATKAHESATRAPGKPVEKLAENKPVKNPPVKSVPQKVTAVKKTPAPESAHPKQEPQHLTKAETLNEIKSPHEQQAAPAKASVAEAPPVAATLTPEKAAASGTEGSVPEFRWPAHGRIIQSFKPGGNDGINIAVPEGTSVKAAESGVVAYAGNELKGYGNLILIRHPNGFVSAYANTSDIEVKRGETVKRGQVIAKSGQSGNVASPQLHFELRKGTTPVDPTQYLAGV